MTKQGIDRVFLLLNAAFGNQFNPTGDELTLKRQLWLDLMGDLSDEEAYAATHRYCSTDHDYPATPGKLYADALDHRKPNVPSPELALMLQMQEDGLTPTERERKWAEFDAQRALEAGEE